MNGLIVARLGDWRSTRASHLAKPGRDTALALQVAHKSHRTTVRAFMTVHTNPRYKEQ